MPNTIKSYVNVRQVTTDETGKVLSAHKQEMEAKWAKIVGDEVTLGPAGVPKFHASSTMTSKVEVVTQDTTWQDIGGVVTTPDFFVADLSKIFGRAVGAVETNGATAELRIVENDGSTDVVLATYTVPDTASAWVQVSFSTTVQPRAGQNTFRLEGRRNGTGSFKARYFSMSLLELP